MQNEESINPADQELESALRDLKPAPPNINRDELIFRAGYQSALGNSGTGGSPVSPRKSSTLQLRLWQTLSGALAAALLLSLIPAFRAPTDHPTLIQNPQPHQIRSSPQFVADFTQVPMPESGWLVVIHKFLLPADPNATTPADSYLTIRQAVLAHGPDALVSPAAVQRNYTNIQRLLDLRPEDVGGEAAFKFITRNLAGDQL